jgi:hypothetical protein
MRTSNLLIHELRTTGAGGANVIEHESFLSVVAKNEFSKLPYTNKLKQGGAPTISMAWRQMVRGGHEGRIIEDIGVKSMYMVRPSLRDLQYPDETPSSQYDRIARILYREGQKSKRNDMMCKFNLS